LSSTGRPLKNRWAPLGNLVKADDDTQRFPRGRPVGPNLQRKEEPLGSVGAQRGPTELQRAPFPLGFSSPFARDGHMPDTIETRQGLLEDNKIDLTVKQLVPITIQVRNEVDLVPHGLHFPCSGNDEKRSSRRYSHMIGFLVTHARRLGGCSACLPSVQRDFGQS